MRVVLTGATGMVGSAVLAELVRAGHEVTAAVRSASSAALVKAGGAAAASVSLTDAAALTELLSAHDAAIHAAAPDSGAAANDAFVTAAVSSGRPSVLTSGTWVHGAGEITDDSPLRPPEQVAWRVASEERLLAGSATATVLAPGIVHGGRPGLLELLVDGPVDAQGRRLLIGDGSQRWSWVHVEDLADLYRRVIESGDGHGRLVAAQPGPPVGDIVRSMRGAEGVVASSIAATRERFGGAFAEALLLDQRVRAVKAPALGWRPGRAVPA